jgi:hypothetical protein
LPQNGQSELLFQKRNAMSEANRVLILGVAIAAVCATPAFAGRHLRPHERALIEAKLKEMGLAHWDDIEGTMPGKLTTLGRTAARSTI